MLLQAEEWEREADELEASLGEKAPRPGPTFLQVEVDLGHLLIKLEKLKVKVEHQINEWDKTGDGRVSKGEFRLDVRKLGLENSLDEVDQLFDKYDRDKGGTLDLDEVRVCWFCVLAMNLIFRHRFSTCNSSKKASSA